MPTSSADAPPFPLNRQQVVYVWLCGLSISCLLVADIIGIKLFSIPLGFEFTLPFGGPRISALEHTCGMLTFPVTFLLTDLINEYYGKKGARRVTYLGLAMGLFVFVVMNVALAMPHLEAPFNVNKDSFATIFGSARIMYIASLAAYLVGQLFDIFVFAIFKRATGGKYVWLRATGSTVISQLIDSFVVTFIAFYFGRMLFPNPDAPPMSIPDVIKTALTGYMLKFVLAIAITPLIYAGRSMMKSWFGLSPVPPEQA